MNRFAALSIVGLSCLVLASAHAEGPFKVIKKQKVGGEGGFDYVYADSAGRSLYVARSGQTGRMSVYDLDSLKLKAEFPIKGGHGAATDAKTHHGFSSSNPVVMWDTKSLKQIKTIDVQGRPDGILNDDFSHKTYIFSHSAPNVTVLDGETGEISGTIDLGGAPEQAQSDGKGTIYVDIEDQNSVAVIDAKTMKVRTTYKLGEAGGGNAGLALDAKKNVLYVACREPAVMVMLDSTTGSVLGKCPIGAGCDGAAFDPKNGYALSSQGDGTLNLIKQNGTSFEPVQTVTTMRGAKTLTVDSKTGRVYLIAAEYAAPAAGQRRGSMVPGSFTILVVGK